MTTENRYFVFINSRTGNVIGHYSLPADIPEKEMLRSLELKRVEVAVTNTLLISMVYWEARE